jgi:hypothetical protein
MTLLLSPNRDVEGGLLKTAARKETKENFMLVEVESMCLCVWSMRLSCVLFAERLQREVRLVICHSRSVA